MQAFQLERKLSLFPVWFPQEVHNELQDLEPVVARLQQTGARLMEKSGDQGGTSIKQNLQLLGQTWDHVKQRSADRKVLLHPNYNL